MNFPYNYSENFHQLNFLVKIICVNRYRVARVLLIPVSSTEFFPLHFISFKKFKILE